MDEVLKELSRLRTVTRGLALKAWIVLAVICLPPAVAEETRPPTIDVLATEYRQVLDQILADSGAPGGVAAFVLPDGRMQRVSSGYSDVEAKLPMSPDSRLLSGSTGKTFVGALSLKLVMEGRLDLDVPIEQWLGGEPWFARLPGGSRMTLRHLLTHSSGLIDHLDTEAFVEAFASGALDLAEGASPEELIEFVLDSELLFPPGDGYAYTDTGYLLAGLVIEKATGNSYYGELRRHILDPLALVETSPSDHTRLPGLVPGYLPEDSYGQGLKTLNTPGVLFYNPATEWTGGGLVTNAGDLARWAWALYEGRAMPGDYVEMLLCSIAVRTGQTYPAYALGQGIQMGPHGLVYGHSGWIPGYLSFMAYFPEHRVAVAAQFNTTRGFGSATDPIALAKERLPRVVIEATTPEGGTK
jgi:D-alanyl-D-alanine carboxypeptidase